MDFFEDQQIARKKTFHLTLLFIVAMVCIMILVYFAATITIGFVIPQAHQAYLASHQGGAMGGNYGHSAMGQSPEFTWWRPMILLGSVVGTILVVGLCCGYRIVQLRLTGGEGVATTLGGVHVTYDTADAKQKQLLNVVEEMAIASGTAVPQVYVLTGEHSINAFAAGFTPNTAVIAVSQGALNLLSRDELQGVIGHEFSHILNGDMRTNVRLIGVIFGIIALTILGSILLRAIFFAGMGGRRSNDRGGGGAMLAIAGFGLLLIVIGYVGMFFARLIQAAISRQREFLADASAVQFTRNPEGIAGALKKIGGCGSKSRLISPHSSQVAHMCFGSASMLGGPMATHPPLAVRIAKIDPSFDGQFPDLDEQMPVDEHTTYQDMQAKLKADNQAAPNAGSAHASTQQQKQQMMQGVLVASVLGGSGEGGREIAPRGASNEQQASSHIGRPTDAHFAYANQLIADLPDSLKNAAHDPHDARAVVYALLLDQKEAVRKTQLDVLRQNTEPHVYQAAGQLYAAAKQIGASARLPLLDMAIPALRKLSASQYEAFKSNVKGLVHADEKVELFEWAIQRTVRHRLDPHFNQAKPAPIRYRKFKPVLDDVVVLLSALSLIGADNLDQAGQAFAVSLKEAGLEGISLLPADQCTHDKLDSALSNLAMLFPGPKKKLINSAAAAILADKNITDREGELLRVICDSLDAPMPPMVSQ